MKLFRLPSKRVTDDEYIAALRRWVATWDRWSDWLVLFQIFLLVAAICVFSMFIPLLNMLVPNNAPLAMLGFAAGTAIGLAFGWIVSGIIHNLLPMVGGFRAERLLLKYYETRNDKEDEGDHRSELGTGFRELHERVNLF